MYSVTTPGVEVPLCVELETVWDSGINVGEDATVAEGACARVDVVFVAVLNSGEME